MICFFLVYKIPDVFNVIVQHLPNCHLRFKIDNANSGSSQDILSIPRFGRVHDLINQSHRYGRHQAAYREPAGSYDKTTRTAICFEHKTQYILIRAPYTRIVVFWHIINIPPMISQSQISVIPPRFI